LLCTAFCILCTTAHILFVPSGRRSYSKDQKPLSTRCYIYLYVCMYKPDCLFISNTLRLFAVVNSNSNIMRKRICGRFFTTFHPGVCPSSFPEFSLIIRLFGERLYSIDLSCDTCEHAIFIITPRDLIGIWLSLKSLDGHVPFDSGGR
jgi:hypothetical protein